ncbi:GNAT family N-acetyltransferase [Streptococcus cuniculi]|uniref:GNAT family N-acetyltransferase n=1 Tax=Streptococcus cuniculi TaxID=1432788 RepID=A0A4Y9JCY5_9STRE|nr:GNAT family N-acetyltransferase [Streptococcus cuniculi]MBF0777659.1 GNAT family N-acetyltransferase [Streptococcus cuniculi]TFU98697.1 GNAT family N-acetyltransferase [Streptococcus cuniculi]
MQKVYKDAEIYEILDQVSDLYDEMYRHEIQESHSLKRRIENSLSSNLHPLIITEELDGQLLGFLFDFDFKPENWWAKQVDKILPPKMDWYRHSFELNELCVKEQYRRKGIGYQLMDYLSSTDFDYILLSVRSANTKAMSLYTRLGYQVLHDHFYFEGGHTLFHIMYSGLRKE